MQFICARQAWHDAFMTDLAAPDFATQAAGVGVQFSARGANNRIVEHCERGYIIAAVHAVRAADFVAYCWGMIAYAPPETATVTEYAAVIGDLRAQFFASKPGGGERYKPEWEQRLKKLARIAIEDCAGDDTRKSKPERRRPLSDVGRVISVSAEDYKNRWAAHYEFFYEACRDYRRRALGLVAAEVKKRADAEAVVY